MTELDHWLNRIEQMHPSNIEMGLDRIKTVAEKLNLLHPSSKVVIVGGTNGKGSTVAMLEAMAISSGLTVAAYTSPHLVCFRERIRLNGRMVEEDVLLSAFKRVDAARSDIALTFFEFTTLAALVVFSESNPALMLLEVGLGGRLDAVNIVKPDVTLISTIALDHTDWLGDSLHDIAFEKSGIFRHDSVNLTANKEAFQLLQSVLAENTSLALVDDSSIGEEISLQLAQSETFVPTDNIRLAIAAFKTLYPDRVSRDLVVQALQAIRLPGRFQSINWTIPLITDVAHNPAACQMLARSLTKNRPVGRRYAVCGFMKDKDIEQSLRSMEAVVDCWLLVDLAEARAESARNLQIQLSRSIPGAESVCMPSVTSAMQYLEAHAGEKDQVIVFGSFITVGNLLQYLGQQDCYEKAES